MAGVVVLKELIFKFLLWEDLVVLKELIFKSFLFGRVVVVLKKLILTADLAEWINLINLRN